MACDDDMPRRRLCDDRRYVRFTLTNGLRVLCVLPDDDEAQQSNNNEFLNVAGMCVWAGSAHDPVSVPGLAHLLEHMLFFGTETHPDNDWKSLVRSAGGSTNAATSHERTCFYFSSVSSTPADDNNSNDDDDDDDDDDDVFWRLLAVWSSFFVCPLLRLADQQSARKAVDSEFRRNRQNDFRRQRQVLRRLARAGSLFRRFATGNLQTLRNDYCGRSSDDDDDDDDLQGKAERGAAATGRCSAAAGDDDNEAAGDLTAALRAFHEQWYVASNMTLCLFLSRQCLRGCNSRAALVERVHGVFAALRSAPAPPAQLPAPAAYRVGGNLPRLVHVLPVKKQRTVQLIWPALPVLDAAARVREYRSKAADFVAHLLGYEGAGSVLAALKRLGWATGLSAGLSDASVDLTAFQVTVELTPNGLAQRDDVVELVFAYLALLQRRCHALAARYDELRLLRAVRFDYGEASRPWLLVKQLSIAMHQPYAADELLTGDYLLFADYDAADVQRWLRLLCEPRGLMLFVSSFDLDAAALPLTEHFYGTLYSRQPLPDSLLHRLQAQCTDDRSNDDDDDDDDDDGFAFWQQRVQLPPLNRYLPDSFDCGVDDDGNNNGAPVQLASDASRLLRVWHQPDVQFRRPKTYVRLALNTAATAVDARSAVLYKLYTRLVRSALNEAVYDALVAGYTLSIKPTAGARGVRVSVHGFTAKMPALLQAVLAGLVELPRLLPVERLAQLFEMERDRLHNSWASIVLQSPSELMHRYAHLLVSPWLVDPSLPAYLDALQAVRFDDLLAFAAAPLRRLVCSTLYVYGGTAQQARHHAQLVAAALQLPATRHDCEPACRQWRAEFRACLLPADCGGALVLAADDARQSNCCCLVTFDAGADDSGDGSAERYATLLLFEQLTAQHVFDRLRTEQNLGYIVRGWADAYYGVLYYKIVVQSQLASPLQLDQAIEAVVQSFDALLDDCGEEALRAHKASLANKLLERCHRSDALVDRNWHDILFGRCTFDRRQRAAAALARLTRADVMHFCRSCFHPASPQRRRFACQFWSEDTYRFPRPSPLVGLSPDQLAAWQAAQSVYSSPLV